MKRSANRSTSMRLFLGLGLALTGLASAAAPQDEEICAKLALSHDVFVPGELGAIYLEGPPGLIPCVFVSLEPDPIETSPFLPRRFPVIPEDGILLLKEVTITCDVPDKYIQAVLYDPRTRRPLCRSNQVFLQVDRRRCEPPKGEEGCTPGYWKQEQHFDSWPEGLTPDTLFSDIFDDAFPGKTLLDVLSQGGGGLRALGRHTVAALLNAGTDVDSGFDTETVIEMFDDVFPGEKSDYETLKNDFADSNEKGCPLN